MEKIINLDTALSILEESDVGWVDGYDDVSFTISVEDPFPTNDYHPFMYVCYETEDGNFEHEFSSTSVADNPIVLVQDEEEETFTITLTDTSGEEFSLIVESFD